MNRLRAVHSSAGAQRLSASHWNWSRDSAVKAKRPVLIVDDNPNNTHFVKIVLEESGPYFLLEENDSVEAQHSQDDRGD